MGGGGGRERERERGVSFLFIFLIFIFIFYLLRHKSPGIQPHAMKKQNKTKNNNNKKEKKKKIIIIKKKNNNNHNNNNHNNNKITCTYMNCTCPLFHYVKEPIYSDSIFLPTDHTLFTSTRLSRLTGRWV